MLLALLRVLLHIRILEINHCLSFSMAWVICWYYSRTTFEKYLHMIARPVNGGPNRGKWLWSKFIVNLKKKRNVLCFRSELTSLKNFYLLGLLDIKRTANSWKKYLKFENSSFFNMLKVAVEKVGRLYRIGKIIWKINIYFLIWKKSQKIENICKICNCMNKVNKSKKLFSLQFWSTKAN